MSDIFVSYAKEDRQRIMALVRALEKTGWSVFWDRTIPTGKTWREFIGDKIKSCRSIVVVWSKISSESRWVKLEAEEGSRRQILFPVLIDDVEPPFGFGDIQAASLVEWDGNPERPAFSRLINDLTALLGEPPAVGDKDKRKAAEQEQRKVEEERKRGREEEGKGRTEGDQAQVERKKGNQKENVPLSFKNYLILLAVAIACLAIYYIQGMIRDSETKSSVAKNEISFFDEGKKKSPKSEVINSVVGITFTDKERLLRNIITGLQDIHVNISHFYRTSIFDWVDANNIKRADVEKTAQLAQSITNWPKESSSYFNQTKNKLISLNMNDNLDIYNGKFSGHPKYKLPPEANLLFLAHHLEALDLAEVVYRINTALGSNVSNFYGHDLSSIDYSINDALNENNVHKLLNLSNELLLFVEKIFMPDLKTMIIFYLDDTTIETSKFIECGAYFDKKGNLLFFRGMIRNKDVAEVYPVPIEPLSKNQDDWCRLISEDHDDLESGSLARLLIGYASGHEEIQASTNKVLRQLGEDSTFLFTDTGRIMARGIETLILTRMLVKWMEELAINVRNGTFYISEDAVPYLHAWPRYNSLYRTKNKIDQVIAVQESRVTDYYLRGGDEKLLDKLNRIPYKKNLVGTHLIEPGKPLEIMRIINSFGPCWACNAIRITDVRGYELSEIILKQ